MITHRQQVVPTPGDMGGTHPSYYLHAVAQNMNSQHRAVQMGQWDSEMAANPHGMRPRAQYRT